MTSNEDLKWLDGYTVIGEIQKPYGVKGEAKVRPETFDPKRFKKTKTTFLANPNTRNIQQVYIESSRLHGETLLVKFDVIHSPEEVANHRFSLVLIPEEDRLPLAEGEFYLSDLENLRVLDAQGKERSVLIDVQEYPANYVFTFIYENQKILAPWIEDCVLEINTEEGFIKMDFEFLGIDEC